MKEWTRPADRVIGHVVASPPIKLNKGDYTEDWAVIEFDSTKVEADELAKHINVIDLASTRLSHYTFMQKMYGYHDPPANYQGLDHLLRLEGTIPVNDMYSGPIKVLKRGAATDLTIGRANNIESYTRSYFKDGERISREWAILPYDFDSGAFSAPGDSGAAVVDGRGRIGGLVTGGCQDITYATPVDFLLKCMAEHGLHCPYIMSSNQ